MLNFKLHNLLTCVFCEIVDVFFYTENVCYFCGTKATYIFVAKNILREEHNIMIVVVLFQSL